MHLKLSEHSLISGTFDVYLKIRYRRIEERRLAIDSRSERVIDVTGTSPHDRGLLWALNHYWRIEERDGGLYMECEALALSRRPPSAVRLLADRFIAQAAKKALIDTLASTRRMLANETASAEDDR